jgi:hypothetical protein
MSNNLPLGSYFQDNLRVGPLYSGTVPTDLLPFNPTQNLSYSSYGNYGPGMFLSPITTWNITPNAAALDNLVATTPATSLPSAGYLTLRGDNSATRVSGGVVQFDWPRVPTVTVTGADAGGLRVTIFGTDWYGFPMQHTYLIDSQQTYPIIGIGEGPGSLSLPAKAFYTVTGVYLNGGLATSASISLGVSDVFGLPFLSNNLGDVVSIGWDSSSELTNWNEGSSLNVLGVFVSGDQTNPATSTTGDTRGLYGVATPSDGVKSLRFTSYVRGADAWINQVANTQFIQLANGIPVTGAQVNTLTPSDFYGFPQFYTGQPS